MNKMFDVLLRKRISTVLNPFIPVLLKLSYCDSALIRAQSKIKTLVEDDFTRYNKKTFKKHFIENLFINQFQQNVLEYPQLDTLEEVSILKKHFAAAQNLIADITNDRKMLDEGNSEEAVAILKKHELTGFKLSRMSKGFGYLSSEYTFMQEALGLNPSLSKTVSEHEDFGIHLIHSFGKDIQAEQYLPKLISGERLTCFAHLEPSNLTSLDQDSLNTIAECSSDNQNYSITGKKTWVYNAKHADSFILSANVISSEGVKLPGITLFLIDKNTPGITIHEPVETIGLTNLNICDVTFNEVVVPSSCVLGNVNEGGELIANALSKGKLNNGGYCIAIMRKLVNKAIHHCIHNEFFKKDKCETKYFRNKIAKIVSQLYAVESMTYLVTGRFDSHTDADVFLESLIVKIYTSEALQFITQQVLEILGTEFFSSDDNLLELLKDSVFYLACDDANDYLRLILSTAGLKYAADYKQKQRITTKVRDLYLNLNWRKLFVGPDLINASKVLEGYLHLMFSEESKLLEDSVFNLYKCTNYLIDKYGNNVYERHRELKFLADILINIYASVAILGRASRAYCMGVKLQEVDHLCAEILVRIYALRVRETTELIYESKNHTSFNDIGSKIINCNKYSDLYSITNSLKIRS